MGEFLDTGPLLKIGLILLKIVLNPLAKNVLIPLGLATEASTRNSAIQTKIVRSIMNPSGLAKQTALIISKI